MRGCFGLFGAVTVLLLLLAVPRAAFSTARSDGSRATADEAQPALLVATFSTDFRVRPRKVCQTGDGSSFVGYRKRHGGSIKWLSWDSDKAVGKGTFWMNDGDPTMAEGTLHPHLAKLIASRVVDGRYTRLILRFRGGDPAYESGHRVYVYRYKLTPAPYGFAW